MSGQIYAFWEGLLSHLHNQNNSYSYNTYDAMDTLVNNVCVRIWIDLTIQFKVP